jgi:hypothetical protein
LKALLKPEAKKPPKGAKREAKTERGREWRVTGYRETKKPPICRKHTSHLMQCQHIQYVRIHIVLLK